MNKLFCDLKTDEEKASFFLSGRGYETGVIAAAIQNDVAMAYHRCAEYKKELAQLRVQSETAAVAGPSTITYVQQVPDKCDRIVWRNKYYHLPLEAAPSQDAEDAARFRFLTEDHANPAAREFVRSLCERLPVMSYSAACAAIDAARAQQEESHDPQAT